LRKTEEKESSERKEATDTGLSVAFDLSWSWNKGMLLHGSFSWFPFRGTIKIDYRKSTCHSPPFVNGWLGQACVTDAVSFFSIRVFGPPLLDDFLLIGSACDFSISPHGL
jgi:hypothetical protein